MITPLDIYLISRLDYLQAFFSIAGTILAVGGGMAIVIGIVSGDEDMKGKHFRRACLVGIGLWIATMIIPSTKEVMAMYVIPKITTSPVTQKLPAEVQALIDKVLYNGKDDK